MPPEGWKCVLGNLHFKIFPRENALDSLRLWCSVSSTLHISQSLQLKFRSDGPVILKDIAWQQKLNYLKELQWLWTFENMHLTSQVGHESLTETQNSYFGAILNFELNKNILNNF